MSFWVNAIWVHTYWVIGRHIVEFEQGGKEKSDYGSNLLDRLSKDLTQLYGKGFSRSNVFQIRQFYIRFSKIQTLSGQFEMEHSETPILKLSWSHYIEILKADKHSIISTVLLNDSIISSLLLCKYTLNRRKIVINF